MLKRSPQPSADQLHRADLILTSGGVSMGAYDTVKEVFTEYGTVEFTKVAMHPGMPQGHGFVGESEDERIPVITLPGNPVSSYISFQNFVRPAINKLRGLPRIDRSTTEGRAGHQGHGFSSKTKRQFARGRFLDDGRVEPVGWRSGFARDRRARAIRLPDRDPRGCGARQCWRHCVDVVSTCEGTSDDRVSRISMIRRRSHGGCRGKGHHRSSGCCARAFVRVELPRWLRCFAVLGVPKGDASLWHG
jgi:hypothetical protein